MVLDYFAINNVKTVVRLNEALYDSEIFTSRNMSHLEMVGTMWHMMTVMLD